MSGYTITIILLISPINLFIWLKNRKGRSPKRPCNFEVWNHNLFCSVQPVYCFFFTIHEEHLAAFVAFENEIS